MNTQLSTVTHLLEPEWVEVVQEHLQVYANAVPLVIEANLLGQFDCEQGLPCDPYSRGYSKPEDINGYMQAYADTATLWAQTVADANEAIYEREPAIEDDYEWIRRGC